MTGKACGIALHLLLFSADFVIGRAGSLRDTYVHSGFWEGARQHVADITKVVQLQNSRARHHLPVWVTGHSLGGGYANCMMLHLLANKRTKDLFSAGRLSAEMNFSIMRCHSKNHFARSGVYEVIVYTDRSEANFVCIHDR